ncbi:MAG: acyl-CoA dehydrogenase family protein [Anaerolineaceae bacterium]
MTQALTGVGQDSAVRSAKELAARFALTAAEVDRTAAFPFSNFEALRDAGLLNLTVPTRFGGSGAGLETACRVVATIGGGEPSTALVYAMHLIYHALAALNRAWTPSVHEMLCRESVRGIALVNVMRVEPELGTPTRGGLPSMTAERTDSGWRISGHKIYATGSPLLRFFICWSRTAGDDPQVGWFVVPREAPGLRILETWDHMGMRATGSHDLILENVEIPAEYAVDIRAPEAWLPPDPVQSSWNNLVLAALYHGIARAAATWLHGYLHSRAPANLGSSLATLPRFQSSVGEIEALLWENERLIFGLAAELDHCSYEAKVASQTAFAKFAATNNAVRAVDIAMGLIGNPGLARSNPLERYHRDVLCSRIHMPQDDMVTLNAGKAALGIQP